MVSCVGLLKLQLDVAVWTHCIFPLPGWFTLQWLKAAPDGTIWASSHNHLVAIWHIKGLCALDCYIGRLKL